MRKFLTLFPLLILSALMATGCGYSFGPDASREDADDTQNVDKSAPEVIAFNNHFPNVSHKCDGHGHRVFVTSNGDEKALQPRMAIVADPSCPGYETNTAARSEVVD